MDNNTEDRLNRYRAKRIRFFINGDKYFRGINYALNTEKIRSFEYLLNDLNRLLNEHSIALIKGVRCIFSLNGECVKDLIDFQEGQAYVCSSIDSFVQTQYLTNNGMLNWLVRNSACISSSRGLKQPNCISSSPSSKLTAKQTPEVVTSRRLTVSNDLPANFSHRSKSPCIRSRQTAPSSANGSSTKQLNKTTKCSNGKNVSQQDNDIYNINNNANQNGSAIIRGSARIRDVSSRRVRCLDTATKTLDSNPTSIESNDQHNNLISSPNSKQTSHNNANHEQITKSSKISVSSPTNQVTRKSPKKDTIVSNNINHVNRNLSPRPKIKTQRPQNGCDNQSHGSTYTKEDDQSPANVLFPIDVMDKYDVGRPIGDGHFSVVYCCMNKETQQFCALKLIDKLKCRGKDDMIYNEVKILKRLKHPNIVKLIEEFDYPKQLYLILELVQDGDLFDAITTVTKFNEVDVATMIHNLSSALTYLHRQGIVHRDIKPENLLIFVQEDGSQSLKLADFGLAVEVEESALYNVCGTAFYVSPEMLNETGYGCKVDVWATGVICYILLCGYPPFTSENENNQDELFDAILAGDFQFAPPYWSKISNHAKTLIKSMLTVDPDQRYTAEQVFNHPWTRGESSNFGDTNPLNLSRLAALKRSL